MQLMVWVTLLDIILNHIYLTDNAATVGVPFLCHLDFGSFLPKSQRKNRRCEHEPVVAFYIILDKKKKIIAWKLTYVTVRSKNDEQMFERPTYLLADYRRLLEG